MRDIFDVATDYLWDVYWTGNAGNPGDGLVEIFYGQMDKTSETQLPDAFKKPNSTCRCLISTVAFGLGMDIPDIEYVLHWGPPETHLQYWQEVGRAGRDGRNAEAIMYLPPYSMDKRRTDESVRLSVKSSQTTCFRGIVLNSLKTEGMTDKEIETCCGHKRCCSFCAMDKDKAPEVSDDMMTSLPDLPNVS